jgi:hypothetical protein
MLWLTGGKVLQGTVDEVLPVLFFLSVPVLLVVTGYLLYSSRAGMWLRVGATCITAVLLGAKALVCCGWAFDALLHMTASFLILHPHLIFLALMALVVVPSGVWALVLAGTAAVLSSEPSDVLGGRAGNEDGSGPTKPSWRRKLARLGGVLTLGLVVELAGIAHLWNTMQPSPITATELLRDYRDNPEEAEAKYRGKWLQVKGRVADNKTTGDFAPGTATTWVTLKADDQDVPGEVAIRVAGEFLVVPLAGASSEDFRKLKKGQEVTIRGKCSGKTAASVLTIESPIIVK